MQKIKVRIQPSKINGVGIFAIDDIKKGENPFLFSYMGMDGMLFHKDELKDLSKEQKKMLEDYYPTNNGKYQYIPAYPNTLIWTNYLNYNYDKPNIQLLEEGQWKALRDIKKGEELFENPKTLFNEDGTHKVFYTKRGLYTHIQYP